MMNFIFGALGVLLVLGLLALGFFIGWRANKLWRTHTSRAVEETLTEQERQALAAQQRAFDSLLNYNAETAYGMNTGLDEVVREDGDV